MATNSNCGYNLLQYRIRLYTIDSIWIRLLSKILHWWEFYAPDCSLFLYWNLSFVWMHLDKKYKFWGLSTLKSLRQSKLGQQVDLEINLSIDWVAIFYGSLFYIQNGCWNPNPSYSAIDNSKMIQQADLLCKIAQWTDFEMYLFVTSFALKSCLMIHLHLKWDASTHKMWKNLISKSACEVILDYLYILGQNYL